MLFQELNKLKWNSVMSSIVLITIGLLMLICPDSYITAMIGTLGSVLLVLAVLGILDFIGSNKALIHYVYLTGYLALAIIGTAILVFEINSLYTISWMFGAFLLLSGLSNIASALTYARRSGRRGWWVLLPLSILQIIFGLVIFLNIILNPWWDTPVALFKAVGLMLLFSSVVSILRLIWVWPIKNE